jgi:hypothetical protein
VTINNAGLWDYYRTIGIEPMAFWPHWVEDFFRPDATKRRNDLIGVQNGPRSSIAYDAVSERFGEDHVLECSGTRREVAEKMQQCGIFFSWNTPALLLCGDGESFGRALSEAMACGCALISRHNVGSESYIDRELVLSHVMHYDRLGYALDGIEAILKNINLGGSLRANSQLKAWMFYFCGRHLAPITYAIDQVRYGL